MKESTREVLPTHIAKAQYYSSANLIIDKNSRVRLQPINIYTKVFLYYNTKMLNRAL